MDQRRKWKGLGQQGASLVETSLVVLLLLLLLAGVVDVGRAFQTYIIITNAAREGARYGSHFPHLAQGIRDAAKNEAADSNVVLEDADISIVPEPPPGASPGDPGVAEPGEAIWVGVEYQFETGMASILGFGVVTLRSATEMVVFGHDE
jgi:hypothetical protein